MREMKDSGIEWIVKIPAIWNEVPIRFVFKECTTKNVLLQEKMALKFTYGSITPKQDFDADRDEYIANTIANYTVVHPGVIMINGLNLNYDFVSKRVGLVKDNGAITSAYLAIEPTDKVIPEYATYQLKSWDAVKAFHNMGTGVRKTLDFSELGKKRFVMPSLAEQQRIASFLDSKCSEIDAISADIQKEIEILEQYKRSVITEAVTKGLNPDVEMKNSGLRWCEKIPATWEVIPAKYLFHNSDTRKFPNDELLTASQKYGLISQTDYMKRENAKIVLANAGIENWKHVEPNDFVISLRSFQGGLEMSEISGCVTWHYVVLRAAQKVFQRYYKWLFKSSKYINALQATCNFIRDGQDLRFSNFAKVPLFIPPYKEQCEIAAYLDEKTTAIDVVMQSKKKQLEVLDSYKKSLIYEYVTGKKEVPYES